MAESARQCWSLSFFLPRTSCLTSRRRRTLGARRFSIPLRHRITGQLRNRVGWCLGEISNAVLAMHRRRQHARRDDLLRHRPRSPREAGKQSSVRVVAALRRMDAATFVGTADRRRHVCGRRMAAHQSLVDAVDAGYWQMCALSRRCNGMDMGCGDVVCLTGCV